MTARRVVRGGSWNDNQANARAANRNHNVPGNRNDNLGLRVARSSHIIVPLLWHRRASPVSSGSAGLPIGLADTGSASESGRRLRFAA